MTGNKRKNNMGQITRDIGEIKYAVKVFVEESKEDRKQFNEKIEGYHREAAQDRKDIKLYFSKIMEEIHMDRVEARKDRKVIAAILRGFTSKQDKMLEKQDQTIDKLGSIEKLLRIWANGGPNGGKRRKKR